MRFFLSVFLLLPLMASAQDSSIYCLKWRKEIALFGFGTASTGFSYLAAGNVPSLTNEQINSLNLLSVPAFDRWSIGNYSHSAARSSDILLYGSMVAPALLLLADPAIRKQPLKPAIIMSEVFAVNYGLTSLTKELAHRTRPYAYDPLVPADIRSQRDARRSFYSGHTSTSAAMCFGYAAIWSSYHPDSRLKPVVWTGAAIVPALTGYLRVRAGEHFLSDVLTGYATGALCGWLVVKWHKKRSGN
jgi:membrane-associated phospholipid phosphatase